MPKVDPRTFSLCLPLGTGKTSEMSWQGDRSLTLPKKPTTNSGDDNNNDESADYKRRPRRSNFHNDFSLLIYYFTITSNYLHLLSHGVLGLHGQELELLPFALVLALPLGCRNENFVIAVDFYHR